MDDAGSHGDSTIAGQTVHGAVRATQADPGRSVSAGRGRFLARHRGATWGGSLGILAFSGLVFWPQLQPAAADLALLARTELHLATTPAEQLAAELPDLHGQVQALGSQNEKLQKSAAALLPPGLYIVVDTESNRLLVRRGGDVLLDAVCSTGSGQALEGGGKRWIFDTPRGVRRVQSKVTLPVWTKPDWAFYEEGKKPPPARSPERLEEGVLGEYALGLGDGYLIHGTLYKRMLGKSVTHGCIRLDDDALAFVYREASIGTPVYIF